MSTTSVTIRDLPLSQELDRQALAEICGGGRDHLRSVSIVRGNWSGYQFMFSNYQGLTYHDGYLTKHTYEGWKRTKTDTEYSYWDRYWRV